MIDALLNKVTTTYKFKESGHRPTEQWKTLSVGETVEYAIEHTDGILYKVESVNKEENTATIVKLDSNGSATDEKYPAPINMLRPYQK